MRGNDRQNLLDRLSSLLLCLRHQRSGTDVHVACNIRHRVVMLINLIEGSDIEDHMGLYYRTIVKKLESETVAFFRKRYSYF